MKKNFHGLALKKSLNSGQALSESKRFPVFQEASTVAGGNANPLRVSVLCIMPIRKQLAESFSEKRRSSEFWIHCFLYACLGLSLWPITFWFAATAHEQSRIFHALLVLVAATILLIRFGGVEISHPLSLNRKARKSLIATYVLLAVSILARQLIFRGPLENVPPFLPASLRIISLLAYCVAITSFALFVFGEKVQRVTYTVAGTFCLFLVLSAFAQPLDWPLRGIAGEWSGSLLEILGKSVELQLTGNGAEPPMLILLVDGHSFHVASECNGFGVILTSLLLAVMLAFHRRLKTSEFLVNVGTGLFLGFLFNTLRIVIIVLLAPQMMERYMLMHEIVGGITYWGCLVLLWILLNGPTHKES